jgi:hypothetical protein
MLDEKSLKILEKLEKEDALTPDNVVQEARSPDSPLHDKFEWDDDVAAHQHRLYQARKLIGSIKIERVVNTRTVSVPKYIHDPRTSDQGYIATTRLKSAKKIALEAVMREYQAIDNALARAEGMAAVLGVEADVRRLRAMAKKSADKIGKAA